MSNRTCYWSPSYQPSKQMVLSGKDNAEYEDIDSLSKDKKQEAWSHIKNTDHELSEIMITSEFNVFKKEAQEIFGAKQIIEV